MSNSERFWRDGYLLLRGVFSPSEVQRWRMRALDRKEDPADLLSDEALKEVVLDERIIDLAREILGEAPIYYGDSSVLVGGELNSFHKDNSDRYDPKAPDWTTDRYPVIRFGIYTEDHMGKPGGLDVRRGSHLHCDTVTGTPIPLEPRPGDLIVWNMRTTHSGHSLRLKLTNQHLIPGSLLWRVVLRSPKLRPKLLRRHESERVAIFLSFAAEGNLFERHLRYLQTRTYMVDTWKASRWSKETRSIARQRGLKLRDLTLFEPSDQDGRSVDYKALAY